MAPRGAAPHGLIGNFSCLSAPGTVSFFSRVVKPVKELMCVRQKSLMQPASAPKKEGDGDAVSGSTDTSRWSTPSKLHRGSDSAQYSSDCEDQADPCADKTPEAKTTDKWLRSKPPVKKKDKKAHVDYKQKTNCAAHRHVRRLPPIKPLQVSNPRIQSPHMNRIGELKSQVWDLQQQLREAQTENKLLKRLQHRHTVALQHFQDSEGSISRILTKHNNEVRVLQGLLRETRACRDRLARQLQATENKLLNTKAALQHLQLLSQDHSLLEREELTLMLSKATTELEEKGQRILDLEKNLELCRASFNRQLVTEQRKISEARNISCFLQEQIYQLSNEIQDRKRELDTHNIYSHRFLKGSTKKGKESNIHQTDGFVLLPTEAVSLLELEDSGTEERLEEQATSVNLCCYNPVKDSLEVENPETEDPVNVTSEEYHKEDAEINADTSEQNRYSKKSPEHQTERDCTEEKEASEVFIKATIVLEEKKPEEHESESDISAKPLNTTEPMREGYKLPKIKRNYTFNQTIENLHSGRPAYSSVDTSPGESTEITKRVEALRSGICELSIVGLSPGKSRRGGVSSPQCE
ncbi:lebercilin-like protein isoform X2 [Trachinotus anak]|uniref:lebercilin-like protein isoform X2 n=1 Tax=Trachinotus anak TaxID=443729 RepID=UPI0039F26195